jgi:hypothetical protein
VAYVGGSGYFMSRTKSVAGCYHTAHMYTDGCIGHGGVIERPISDSPVLGVQIRRTFCQSSLDGHADLDQMVKGHAPTSKPGFWKGNRADGRVRLGRGVRDGSLKRCWAILWTGWNTRSR